MMRLSHFWYEKVEIKHLSKARNYILGGDFIEEIVTFIRFKFGGVIPFNDSNSDHTPPTHQQYQLNVCKTFFFTSAGKCASPFLFLLLYTFLSKGYNAPYFPFDHQSENGFNTTVIYVSISCVTYTLAVICCIFFTKNYYNLPVARESVYLVKQNFWICVGNVMGSMSFPIIMTTLHYNTWHYLFKVEV